MTDVAAERSAAVKPSRARSSRGWSLFAIPGVVWLIAFFLIPIYAVMSVAFGSVDPILRISEPQWNPIAWDFAAFNDVLGRVFTDDLRTVFIRTGWFVGLALLGCILIGYPIAYYVARKAGRRRGLILALLVMPFWISYLMRMLAWTNLLQPDGFVNQVIGWFGGPSDRNWLDGAWPPVVIGLIYGYLPFFILPLYSSLERIDERLIEAGRDLGAGKVGTFLRITFPLSIPGLLAASVITILPMFGDYYTNSYLTSGSPKTTMIGNQIVEYLSQSTQPQVGASLVLILMGFLLVLMIYYLMSTIRDQRQAER